MLRPRDQCDLAGARGPQRDGDARGRHWRQRAVLEHAPRGALRVVVPRRAGHRRLHAAHHLEDGAGGTERGCDRVVGCRSVLHARAAHFVLRRVPAPYELEQAVPAAPHRSAAVDGAHIQYQRVVRVALPPHSHLPRHDPRVLRGVRGLLLLHVPCQLPGGAARQRRGAAGHQAAPEPLVAHELGAAAVAQRHALPEQLQGRCAQLRRGAPHAHGAGAHPAGLRRVLRGRSVARQGLPVHIAHLQLLADVGDLLLGDALLRRARGPRAHQTDLQIPLREVDRLLHLVAGSIHLDFGEGRSPQQVQPELERAPGGHHRRWAAGLHHLLRDVLFLARARVLVPGQALRDGAARGAHADGINT
mmetsp:Transcript_129/g.498  ORF Transcript_129/g.498 Transcript_129/m.498 type:complete len:360 (-) Transcript_129:371-1450(-)